MPFWGKAVPPGRSGTGASRAEPRRASHAPKHLTKNFPTKERKVVQFRLESFKMFNHPNLMLSDNNFNTATAGLISQAVETRRGGPRLFQASLKFVF